MKVNFAYATRPGNLALSMICFAGLALLSAFLWNVASGYVLLLFIPALLICFFQLVVTPTHGMRMEDDAWFITDDGGTRRVGNDEIAHLKIATKGAITRGTLVLSDEDEVEIPFDLQPNPLDLIHAATERGVPVRTG